MLLCLFVPSIVTTDVKSLYNKHLEFRWHSTDKGNKQNCSHKNHYSIFVPYTCPKQLYFKLQVLPTNHMVCNGNYLCYLLCNIFMAVFESKCSCFPYDYWWHLYDMGRNTRPAIKSSETTEWKIVNNKIWLQDIKRRNWVFRHKRKIDHNQNI